MPYATLAEFLAELHDSGELIRIAAPVDSALELAAITVRVVRSNPTGGPALLFENVKNATIPVVNGRNTIVIRAYDAAGNSGWRTLVVTR